MKRLTIKELAPYLPFKLQWKFEGSDDIHEVMGIDITDFGIHLFSHYGDYGKCRIYEGKPTLRPLSQLTEEIEHNGERFVPIEYNAFKHSKDDIIEFISKYRHYKSMKYGIIERLIEWHFDVFGLIDRNLALPIEGKEVEGD